MTRLIAIILEIVWTLVKGVARQHEDEKKRRKELHEEAKKVWSNHPARRRIDRMWSRLRK